MKLRQAKKILSDLPQIKPRSFCPATMCPLFAREGSPWTGESNSQCERDPCGWWQRGGCVATGAAMEQIVDLFDGKGPAKTFDCQRAHECQWQQQSGDELCPPRYALAMGVDPRAAAY